MLTALIVLAIVVFGSLTVAVVYVGVKDRHSARRAKDVQRADDAQASADPNSLNPSDRAGNAATKYI